MSDQQAKGLHRHTREIRDKYPDALYPLLVELAEYNRDYWLEEPMDETIGAEEVRETGLTAMEQELAETVAKRLERYEEWACDWCGVNKSTATRGVDGPALCNECIFEEDD